MLSPKLTIPKVRFDSATSPFETELPHRTYEDATQMRVRPSAYNREREKKEEEKKNSEYLTKGEKI